MWVQGTVRFGLVHDIPYYPSYPLGRTKRKPPRREAVFGEDGLVWELGVVLFKPFAYLDENVKVNLIYFNEVWVVLILEIDDTL